MKLFTTVSTVIIASVLAIGSIGFVTQLEWSGEDEEEIAIEDLIAKHSTISEQFAVGEIYIGDLAPGETVTIQVPIEIIEKHVRNYDWTVYLGDQSGPRMTKDTARDVIAGMYRYWAESPESTRKKAVVYRLAKYTGPMKWRPNGKYGDDDRLILFWDIAGKGPRDVNMTALHEQSKRIELQDLWEQYDSSKIR